VKALNAKTGVKGGGDAGRASITGAGDKLNATAQAAREVVQGMISGVKIA